MTSAMMTGAKLSLPVTEGRDHIRGPGTAPVTVVEYGDYECPYCGQAYWEVKELERRAGDLMRFVFRNFPLTSVHPHAERAAEAAEAAGAQGKFWEMHDSLYENQQALDDGHLVEYASWAGLDVPQFLRDMDGGQPAERVREDFMSGARSGVNGTPTFFINGFRHDGGWDMATLMDAVERAAGARRR